MLTPTAAFSPDTILVITWGPERHRRLFNLRLKADRDGLVRLVSWLTSHGTPFMGRPLEETPDTAIHIKDTD